MLLQGQLGELGDLLIQRLKALETSFKLRWSTEMIDFVDKTGFHPIGAPSHYLPGMLRPFEPQGSARRSKEGGCWGRAAASLPLQERAIEGNIFQRGVETTNQNSM